MRQEELFESRRRFRLGDLWLLFAQVVTILLGIVFVTAIFGTKVGTELSMQQMGLGNDISFRHSLERIMPSVVSIRAKTENGGIGDDHSEIINLGSGVIVSTDGYVVTNHHVVLEADEINVVTSAGEDIEARVLGFDRDIDIAVLQLVTDQQMQAVEFQSENNPLKVGDMVMSVGSPYGLTNTASLGIVSATGRRNLGLSKYEYFIQTDAAINHGSSGGALTNVYGELVGLNTALFSKQVKGNFAQGIGFAIPAAVVKAAYQEIVEHGRFRRGWIGVELKLLDERIPKSSLDALRIGEVVFASPADKAGIQPGDLVLAIDGRKPSQISFLEEITGSLLTPGRKLSLTILRDNTEQTIEVDVVER